MDHDITPGASKIELRSGTYDFHPQKMIKNCEAEYQNFIDQINQCNNITRHRAAEVTKTSRSRLISCCAENYLNSFNIN